MELKRHLILTLAPTSHLLWTPPSNDGTFNTPLGNLTSVMTAWSTMPDVLVAPGTGLWVGLTYYFMDPTDEKLSDLSDWDGSAYRVVSAASSELVVRYPQGFREGAYLELLFQPNAKGVQVLAQLDFSSCGWLWHKKSSLPTGVVLYDADETAQDLELKLPPISLKPVDD